jgi:Thioredoxin-like [2Fe-2S] ferredoxin
MVTIEEVECLAACDGAPVVQVNTENYERLSAGEAMKLLEALLRDEVPPPTFAADGSVTEPSTAGLHWRLAGLGDPPAAFAATAAAAAEDRAEPAASEDRAEPAAAGDGRPAARDIGREPSPPEPTEQREAGEPQPEEGAGAAAPEAPTEPAPQDPEAAHEAPGDEGPAPEPAPEKRTAEPEAPADGPPTEPGTPADGPPTGRVADGEAGRERPSTTPPEGSGEGR